MKKNTIKLSPVELEMPRCMRLLPLMRLKPMMMALIGALAFTEPGLSQTPTGVPGTWTMTFQDEFNGTSVDGTKWRLGSHHNSIAGVGGNSPQNVSVSGGKLLLKAEQRTVNYGGGAFNYATGEVSTFFKHAQQYGYMEARIKYPAVTGLWPAFWLMPDRGSYGNRDSYRRAFLKFNLTGVNPGTVTSAILKLKVSSMETGGTNNLVAMKLTNDSWSESTIKWSNQPTADPIWIAQKWNNQVSVGSEITIDVTNYVAQEMSGDKIVSLVLADTYMRTKLLAFHSSEAVNTADRPKLEINGVAYVASEDATVRWGTFANTIYGNTADIGVKDDWGDTATTFNGGMEVDVMESLGIWGADVTSHALHWDGYDTSHKSAGWGKMNYPSTPDGFHTYGVYWQSGLLAFYIDGIKTAEYADARVLSVPAYFLLSLQLGGWDNNNAGAQVHNQVMEVDWLRAWSGTRAAPTTVTVDNVDTSSTEVVGTWTGSSFTPGYLGTNYAHDGNAGKGTKAFTYLPALTADYDYLVYTRWTSDANRANNVPIDIMSSNGGFSTVTADQRTNGGAWNLLGVYSLAVMNAEATIRTTSTNGYVVADAMRFKPAPTAGAITVDNADTARVTSTGAWTSTTANAGYLGSNYLHDQNTGKGTKSFSFKPVIASAGDYLVYARWPSDANRANNVPVDIVKTGGMVSTVTVNQQVNNNTWTLLGLYPLSPTNAEVKIRTNGTSGYVIADGVRVIPAGTP